MSHYSVGFFLISLHLFKKFSTITFHRSLDLVNFKDHVKCFMVSAFILDKMDSVRCVKIWSWE